MSTEPDVRIVYGIPWPLKPEEKWIDEELWNVNLAHWYKDLPEDKIPVHLVSGGVPWCGHYIVAIKEETIVCTSEKATQLIDSKAILSNAPLRANVAACAKTLEDFYRRVGLAWTITEDRSVGWFVLVFLNHL